MEITNEYIGTLLDKYGNMILRVAYTYVKGRDDAEDVLQDVFYQIVDKRPIYENEEHEKAWILRATINLCKNRLKSFWNRNKCSIDDFQDIAHYDEYKEENTVLKAVMNLPDKYRIVVYMFYYEGYGTAQIAEMTGQTDTAVRSLLHRARKKLKTVLKEVYDFE